jgi:hypothetical protein
MCLVQRGCCRGVTIRFLLAPNYRVTSTYNKGIEAFYLPRLVQAQNEKSSDIMLWLMSSAQTVVTPVVVRPLPTVR